MEEILELFYIMILMGCFLVTLLLIATPFVLMEWFESKLSVWKNILISGGTYLLTFSFGIYLMMNLSSIFSGYKTEGTVAIAMFIFMIINSLPLVIGAIIKGRKNIA